MSKPFVQIYHWYALPSPRESVDDWTRDGEKRMKSVHNETLNIRSFPISLLPRILMAGYGDVKILLSV